MNEIKNLWKSQNIITFDTKGNIHPVEIIKIETINNSAILQKYNNAKSQMKIPNEQFVFHGTHPDNLPSILKSGFDLTKINKNDVNGMGNGIYVSRLGHVSMWYCKVICDGATEFPLLVCKALLGKEYKYDKHPMNHEYSKIPGYDTHHRAKKCTLSKDCSFHGYSAHDESVIFDIDRLLPLYILHLKIQ